MGIPNNYAQFKETLMHSNPPENWSEALRALWYAAKDNWNASHNIAQDLHTRMGSWIHAYLHRQEGDDWNAGYWYRQAGEPFPNKSLEDELQHLIEVVLKS
ncbi:hypothetical protein [Flagellimonas flava]|uniref:Uncharacterized protein n=1 Tax=Flagellimonas flava TaxID=570519 RepID=A0A1M5I8U3_9FLAO|nr:hypothetical protein [Allomuricauda flava]SHG24808.1 hypothetical protein SAMN04488116_0538 [Allomuricauda flava]